MNYKPVQIRSIGMAIPETVITNDDLTKAKLVLEDKFKPFIGKISYLWTNRKKMN